MTGLAKVALFMRGGAVIHARFRGEDAAARAHDSTQPVLQGNGKSEGQVVSFTDDNGQAVRIAADEIIACIVEENARN